MGPGASTSTATARCSKRAVDSPTRSPDSRRCRRGDRPRGPRAHRAAPAGQASGGRLGVSRRQARARRGSAASGLARELREELGITLTGPPARLIRVHHRVRLWRGADRYVGGAALLAASRADLTARRCAGARRMSSSRSELLPADGPIVAALRLPERLTQASTRDYVLGRSAEAGCRGTAVRRVVLRTGGGDGGERCRRGLFGAAGGLPHGEIRSICELVPVPVYVRGVGVEEAWEIGAAGIAEIGA